MANTTISIRMNEELKRQFESFCDDVGMSMTTAFTIFARKTVRENRIPFEVGGDVPNAGTLEAFREAERMRKDPTLGKTYSSAAEMMKDLLSGV